MRKKCTIISALSIAIIIFFCSCSNAANAVYEYDNKTAASDLPVADISENELAMLNTPFGVSISTVRTLDTMKEINLAKIVRYNNSRYYTVDLLSDNRYLFVLYEEIDGELQVTDGFVVSKLTDKAAFADISIGSSREDVIAVDENAVFGDYFSYHRCSDGTYIEIEYQKNADDEFEVSNIYEEMNSKESVITYLINKDLELIIS